MTGRKIVFDEILFKIRESQRIHDGDRSHPRLVKLDVLCRMMKSDGLEQDYWDAMANHLKCNDSNCINIIGFNRIMEGMKRKQSLRIGDHLQNLVLSWLGKGCSDGPKCLYA